MTPQLQQAIKLLALSNLELEAYLAEALEGNPLLDAAPAGREGEGDEPGEDTPAPGEAPDPDLALASDAGTDLDVDFAEEREGEGGRLGGIEVGCEARISDGIEPLGQLGVVGDDEPASGAAEARVGADRQSGGEGRRGTGGV